MKTMHKLFGGAALFALASSLSAQFAVFTDDFSTPTANVNTAGYFAAGNFGTGADINVSGGTMNVVYGASGGGLANISRYFPTQTLAVGEWIQLDFTLFAIGNVSSVQRNLRFSLGYVSAATQLTGNTALRSPIDSPGFTGFMGAIATTPGGLTSIGSINGTGNVVHVEGAAANGFTGGSLTWHADSTTQHLPTNFSDLDGTLLITRTADGYDTLVSIGGVSLQASHTGGPAAFNTFGFGFNGGLASGNGYAFDSVSVTVIPEPSTYAALFGVLGLGLVVWRRRIRALSAK